MKKSYLLILSFLLSITLVQAQNDNLTPPTNFSVSESGLASWQNPLVQLSYHSGETSDCYYQNYNFGYGVVFDLSDYPDAAANTLEFNHISMGLNGTWDYKIHIINWDTKEIIGSFTGLSTTGDDQWETVVFDQRQDLDGAEMVAFLLEPLGNGPNDAYPDLTADGDGASQNSIIGPLNDLNSFGTSLIGNFLINIYIETSSGKTVSAPKAVDLPIAVNTNIKSNPLSTNSQNISSNKQSQSAIGYHLYLNNYLVNTTTEMNWQFEELTIGQDYNAGISAIYTDGESEIIEFEFTAAETLSTSNITYDQDGLIKALPNPTTNQVSLISTKDISIQEVQIIDICGKILNSIKYGNQSENTVDLSSYPQGTYFLKVKTKEGIKTCKVIKK